MAERATGRTRSINVQTAQGYAETVPKSAVGSVITVDTINATQFWGQAHVFGMRTSLDFALQTRIVFETVNTAHLEYRLAAITVLQKPEGGFTIAYNFSAVTSGPSFFVSGFGGLPWGTTFSATPGGQMGAGTGADYEVQQSSWTSEADLTFTEYEEPTHTLGHNVVEDRLYERLTAYSVEITGSVTVEDLQGYPTFISSGSVSYGSTINLSFTVGGSLAASASGLTKRMESSSYSDPTKRHYDLTFFPLACVNTTGTCWIRVDGPGLQWTINKREESPSGNTSLEIANDLVDPLKMRVIVATNRNLFQAAASFAVSLGPDWALSAALSNRHYEDGSTLNVDAYWAAYYQDLFIETPFVRYPKWYAESFPAGVNGCRLPETGYYHWLNFSITAPHESWSAGELDYREWGQALNRAKTRDFVSGVDVFDKNCVLPIPMVDETWADTYGTLAASEQFYNCRRFYELKVGDPATVARLRLADVHRFTLWDSAASWTYAGGVALQGDGSLRFTVSAPSWVSPAATTTYRLQHFGYRYARLRVKSSVAGAQFRLVAYPATTFTEYYWTFTIAEADTWQVITVDLARPTSDTGKILHPAASAGFLFNLSRASVGSVVKLYFNTAATFDFDYLEGYHRPEGDEEENRTPARLLAPLCSRPLVLHDPSDEPAALRLRDLPRGEYPAGAIGGGVYGRLIVNGVLGLTFQSETTAAIQDTGWPQVYLEDVWEYFQYKYGLVACDSGLEIETFANAVASEAKLYNGYALEDAPLWEAALTLGDWQEVRGQVRVQTVYGYPGSGDFQTGDYDPVCVYYGDRLWDGEILGNNYTKGRAAETLFILADNDTETTLASTTADADGFFRLFQKYGVVKPYSNAPLPDPLGVAVDADRKQYTNVPSTVVFTYTPLGLNLNAGWLSGSIRNKDAEGYYQGTLLSPDFTTIPLARWDFVTLDSWASWYDIPALGDNNWPWLLRDYTWQRFIFLSNADGQMTVRRYDHADAYQDTVLIDSDPDCRQPTFDLEGGTILGVYLRGETPILAQSFDHGATWTLTELPGTFESITKAHHRRRMVVLGFRDNAWWVMVAPLDANNEYTDWSTEVELVLTDPDAKGHLRTREDGPLEFAWQNLAGEAFVHTCAVLALDGTGDWL